MGGKLRGITARTGAKLLIAALLITVAVRLTGLPAHTSTFAPGSTSAQTRTPSRPAETAMAVPAVAPPEEAFVVKRILKIDGPLEHGAWAWDDEGVPAGPILITVDLTAQTLSVFRDGYEIGTAVILYGAGEKPTPLGAFSISEKDADHVSNIYGAPMPYMLRLTNDGVSIHGSEVEWGAATHGCIGVPMRFAALLFAEVKLGDRVIITDGEMLRLGDRIPAA